MSQDSAPKIVVGIDFGTTYSGVAWATSTQPKQIYTVTKWSGTSRHNHNKEKVPSTIIYREPGRKPVWGYDVKPGESHLKWFKLLLIDEGDLQPNLQTNPQVMAAQRQLSGANKTAVEVIADYLRELWDKSLASIIREIGSELYSHSRLVVSVTLPAIWPAYAQARMREAVTIAGILDEREVGETVLRYISEPEAAALAAIEDMAGRPDLKENDHLMVCDAGGGTVDIITYMIVSTDPLVVQESTRGDGAVCGAIFLDEGFTKLLRRKAPRDVFSQLGADELDRIMIVDWENGLKPQAADKFDAWPIPLPVGASSENGRQVSEVVFRGSDIRSIFQPVVLKIESLVTAQLVELKRLYKKQPKYVMLVGGFGKSNYLYNHLRTVIHKNIEILQSSGERPWTAICRGAVLNGLTRDTAATSVAIDSRIARENYGTVSNILPWDSQEHDAKDKLWCSIQEEFLAIDQVQWFLRIDQPITQDEPVVHSFFQDFEKPADEIITELVCCRDDDPPSRCTSSVRPLCKIKWSKIPNFTTLPLWTNKRGKKFRQICYDIKMTIDSGSLEFAIYHEGDRVASQNVSVEFDPVGAFSRIHDDSDAFSDI